MTGKLNEIAAGQRASLAPAGQGSREVLLPRGLRVRLVREDDRYWLQLARSDALPSVAELAICEEAWGAPPGSDWQRSTERDANPVTRHTVVWQTMTTSWRESDVPRSQGALELGEER